MTWCSKRCPPDVQSDFRRQLVEDSEGGQIITVLEVEILTWIGQFVQKGLQSLRIHHEGSVRDAHLCSKFGDAGSLVEVILDC